MKTINNIVVRLVVLSLLFIGCGQGQTITPEKRIYSFDGYTKSLVSSTNLDFTDTHTEFEIPKPDPRSDYVLKSGSGFYPRLSVISISRDKKFIFVSTEFEKYIDVENGEKCIIDGEEIERIEATEYSIYKPSTKEFHYIGALCSYRRFNYDGTETAKEIGHKYHSAGWLENELLLVEITKDDKFYTQGQDASLRACEDNLDEVPYATARAMSFSLKDFKLSSTNKFRPLKPWVSYSDAYTGIIGYFDPFYPFVRASHIFLPEFPNNCYGSVVTTLTDFKCTKTYDLFELAKEVLPENYILGHTNLCSVMVDQNGRRMCYYYMEGHHKDILKYDIDDPEWKESYPPIPRREYVVFGLDFDTGKIEKYMTTDQIFSEIDRLYGKEYKITEKYIYHPGFVLDGATKETGTMIFFFCYFCYKNILHINSKIPDGISIMCKLSGPNLNKLEIKKMDNINNTELLLFIR